MKTKKAAIRSKNKDSLPRNAGQLAAKAFAIEKLSEKAREHWHGLKVEQKQARKAYKQAKRAAKAARREAEVALKAAKHAIMRDIKAKKRNDET